LALGLLALEDDRVTLTVPAAHVPGLVEALLHLYQAKAESLQHRTNDLIRGEGSADALVRARDELRSLDEAIEQLGWDPGASGRRGQVRAGRAVLREATLATIDDAGERLNGLCSALVRGEGSVADLRAQLRALEGLLELLRETEGA
jgi:hypothetical protein